MTTAKVRSNNWLTVLGAIFAMCLACGAVFMCGSLLPPTDSTPTSTTTAKAESIIIQTVQIAFTSTAIMTSTNLPTLTKPPTAIPSLTSIPTNTVIFRLPTQAPATARATSNVIVPINPPVSGNGTCSCSGDNLNCPNFPDQPSAQACLDYCIQQGAGDINKLDHDNDGLACEDNKP